MFSGLLSFFHSLPPQIIVALVSMVPIGELRAGLPLGVSVYHLSYWEAFIWSVVGNVIPVYFILKFIGPLSYWLSKRFKFFRLFFDWLFERTRNRMAKKYESYGLFALMMFVAIPLPITGAWTGALAAWLFGLDFKKSIWFILAGVLIAGIIVSLALSGVLGIISFLI